MRKEEKQTNITFKTIVSSLGRKRQMQEHRAEVERYNYNALTVTSAVGLSCCMVLFILSLPFVGVLKLTLPYALLTLFFGGVFLLTKTALRSHKGLALPFYYLLMIIVMLLSIYMGTAAGRTTNATTFLLFLLLLPVFIIDYPWRLITVNAAMAILFCFVDVHFKRGQILSLDISNTIVVCALSAVFIAVTVRRNLNNFKFVKDEREKTTEKDALINAIPVGVAIYEVRGYNTKQVYTNDEFYRLFADTREEREKRTKGNFLESIYPDDRADLLKMMKSVIDGRDYMVMVCRSIKGDGSYLWVRFAASVAKREGDYIEVYCTYSSMEEEMRSKQASEAKTAFLSRMSHDIRTPMNAIIGMTNLAKQEDDNAKVREYLDHIDNSSKFLLGLINDILDLSKIESGEFTLNDELYDIKDFDADVHTIIGPLMAKKNIRFIYEMDSRLKCIVTDKLRFNQIFFNLLSNASKFTPAGGVVEFSSELIPGEKGRQGVRFTVRDNGVGMSEEYMKNMFTPFVQDSYQAQDQQTGTGLGLPIVKSIVDAMHGTLEVHSELGRGTEFVVDLYVETLDGCSSAEPEPSAEQSIEGMRILLAEDNKLNIMVSKKLLESRGCSVTVAKDGEECVKTFESSAPGCFDAILMDVRMPKMDGIEATKRIRAMAREDAAAVPIIAMTADAFTEEKKKTLDAGMNAHLTKPVEPDKLFRTLAASQKR